MNSHSFVLVMVLTLILQYRLGIRVVVKDRVGFGLCWVRDDYLHPKQHRMSLYPMYTLAAGLLYSQLDGSNPMLDLLHTTFLLQALHTAIIADFRNPELLDRVPYEQFA